MLRLKQKLAEESYPHEQCAAARCVEVAAIIDQTGRLCVGPVPLCDYHWQVRCALDEELPAGAVPHHRRLPAAAQPGEERVEAQVAVVSVTAGQLRLPFARR